MMIKKRSTPPQLSVLTVGLGVVIAGLLVGQIVLSNHLATEGKTVVEVEKEIAKLDQENRQLRTQRGEMASLSTVALQAEKSGFIKNPLIIAFPQDQTVALKP